MAGVERHPGPVEVPTNADTVDWYKQTLKTGNITEDYMKIEAVKFFGDHLTIVNKRTIKTKLTIFYNKYKVMKVRAQQKAKKEESDYKTNDEFCAWLNEVTNIEAFKIIRNTEKKKTTEVKETLVITNKQSKNILEVSRPIFTTMSDGTVKKTTVKETYAKVTTRTKNKENKDPDKNELTRQTMRNRRISANEVIDHLTENITDKKAEMVSQIIDSEGKEFANKVKRGSKTLQENEALTDEQTNSLMTGTRVPELAFRQMRTVFKKVLGYSPIASQDKVRKLREKIMIVKKEDWKVELKTIFRNKQGQEKDISTETPVISVKDLPNYIEKLANGESGELDFSMGCLPVCFDADAGGGRFVASFTFLNSLDTKVKLHPFLLFEGSDNRKNMEITLGEFTSEIENLQGKVIKIDDMDLKIEIFALFDLCALNCLIGKQNHSSTFPCAWTNVQKNHLSAEAHSNKPHTPSDCPAIKFLTIRDYETNVSHHKVEHSGKQLAKTGKDFGSVVANNLFPLHDILRYIPPVMHIIMGLTNDSIKELKVSVIKLDEPASNPVLDGHKIEVQKKLVEMYDEVENLENQESNIYLAITVVLNDLKRVVLIKENNMDEASKIAKENYPAKIRINKNKPKPQCDADLCLIFEVDVVHDWDAMFTCKNMCSIHIRCEGVALIDPDDEIPSDYTCKKCATDSSNMEWIEKALETEMKNLKHKQNQVTKRIASVKAEIVFHENTELKFSGSHQRLFKEALKTMGDIARFVI